MNRKLRDLLLDIDIISQIGSFDLTICDIVFDSRKVKKDSLFVAQKGTQIDGHSFIDSAINDGASVVVLEQMPEQIKENVTYLQVADSSKALALLARNYYDNPSSKLKLIGITGTNGKTTTVTLSYNLFKNLGYECGLISTIVNKIGDREIASTHTTPDSLSLNKLLNEMVDCGCEYVFMEVSSHAVDQHRIWGLTYYGGVFSNITHDHLDYHKTFANYINAKKGFFDSLNEKAFSLTNIDDRNGEKMLESTKSRKFTYSLSRMADYKAKIIENSFFGLLLNINGKEVSTQLVGQFNAYNLLAIYSIAELCGLKQEEILVGLSKLKAANGRFETYRLKNGVTAIIDYAHTPDALLNVISTINEIKLEGKLITVVGCGGNRDKTKRPEMAKIAQEGSNIVILTSDNPRFENPDAIIEDMKKGVVDNESLFCITDRRQAIKLASQLAKDKNDIILIAGKGHETYQEIEGVKHHFDDKEEVLKY